jgi:hypothetical protein
MLTAIRRRALIGAGAAVAAGILLLPAAASWLGQAEKRPVPAPVQLRDSRELPQRDAGRRSRRARSADAARPRASSRVPRKGARPADLAPASAGGSSRSRPSAGEASGPFATTDEDDVQSPEDVPERTDDNEDAFEEEGEPADD